MTNGEFKVELEKRTVAFSVLVLTRLSTFDPKFDFFHVVN